MRIHPRRHVDLPSAGNNLLSALTWLHLLFQVGTTDNLTSKAPHYPYLANIHGIQCMKYMVAKENCRLIRKVRFAEGGMGLINIMKFGEGRLKPKGFTRGRCNGSI